MRYAVKSPIVVGIAVAVRANAESCVQRIGVGLLVSEIGAGAVQYLNAAHNMLHLGRKDFGKSKIPGCGRIAPADYLRMRENSDRLGSILESINKGRESVCQNIAVCVQNENFAGLANGNIKAVFLKINNLALRAGEDDSFHRPCIFFRNKATEEMLVVDGFRVVRHNRKIHASVRLDHLEVILGKF